MFFRDKTRSNSKARLEASFDHSHDTNVTLSMANVEGYRLPLYIHWLHLFFKNHMFASTSHCHKKEWHLAATKARIIIRIFKIQDPDLSFRPEQDGQVMRMGREVFQPENLMDIYEIM